MEENESLIARIQAERGEVLHLYAMLLQSPPFAEGWLGLLTAVRHQGCLDGAMRELMIMRVAHLNDAPYEAEQHRPIALREGLSNTQIDAVGALGVRAVFSPRQTSALHYCDAMTRDVKVPDEVFTAIRQAFTDREIVELTITIAAYNMVSRTLQALGIHSEDDKGEWSRMRPQKC